MKEIKICGLKRMEDIEYVNEFRPDYVGFVFANSKRQVSIPKGAALCKELSSEIKKVGVFVNEEPKIINRAIKECGLDIVQLHGDEKPDFASFVDSKVWKAFRVKSAKDIAYIESYPVSGYLLDAYSEAIYGGTGMRFNWDIVRKVKTYKKLILAGGINIDNIEEAIRISNVDVIDISGGVETDGVKDKNKIRELIGKVRNHG
jgi:phosphoribosylanthranilate isomerase